MRWWLAVSGGRHRRQPDRRPWRWPATLFASSLGLLVITIGYARGWSQHPYALAFFYLGLAMLTLPAGLLLCRRDTSRHDLLMVSVGLGILLYLAYFLSSPLLPARFDETLHSATLLDLLAGHGLLHPSAMLPISPYYPGLELGTAGVRWLTGMPVICCQFVIVLLCRLALLLLLFLLVERFARGPRPAAVAVALYTTTPQFFFFNAQYAYQTLAITLLLGILLCVVRAIDASGRGAVVGNLAAAAAQCAALAITHHLISWLTAGLLVGWLLLLAVTGRWREARIVGALTTVAGLLICAWTLVLGHRLAAYLGPLFTDATHQLGSILAGDQSSRTLFVDSSGDVTPTWEKVAIDSSVLMWCALSALSGWAAARGRTFGRSSKRWLPTLVALCYPGLVVVRVSATATAIADRASTFVLMATSMLAAAWLIPKLSGRRSPVLAGAFVLLMVGGTILGSGPDWSRVPGRYLPGSEQRSIDAASIAAVDWSGAHLPAGSRVAADLTLDRLIPAMTGLHPVTRTGGEADVVPLYEEPTVDTAVISLLRTARISYVFIDTRLATGRAHGPVVFDSVERVPPPTAAELAKFRHAPGVQMLYDGPVQIYDVRALSGAGQAGSDSKPELPDVGQRPVQEALAAGCLLLVLWLVRRRPRLDSLAMLPVTVLVPAIVIGLLGVAAGFRPAWGYALTLGLTAWAVVLTRRRRRASDVASPSPTRWLARVDTAWTLALVASLAAAVVVAILGARTGLYPAHPPGHAVIASTP